MQADPTSYQTAIGTRPNVSTLSTSALFPSGVQNWKPSAPSCSLSQPTSLNFYTYANDDPVNNVDPSGLGASACTLDIKATVGGAVALFFSATTLVFVFTLGLFLVSASSLETCIEANTPEYWTIFEW